MSIIEVGNIFKSIQKVIKKRKNVELHEPDIGTKEVDYLKYAVEKKFISRKGNFLDKFENKIKKITNSKYVILTSSGTSALHLSLLSINIKKDNEILMPTLNYIASANATLYCKAIPHFIDSESETLGIDTEKLDKYLRKIAVMKKNICYNRFTKNPIKALICLHTFGYPAKIQEIKKICKNYNLKLIEDSAEALGSYYSGKHLGTFGDLGILSFNGNKIITTGSGGAILTNSRNIYKICDHLSKIAKKKHIYKLDYDYLGYNYSMANINAAIGLAQIENLKKILKKKKLLNERYIKEFKKYKFLKIFEESKLSESNHWLNTAVFNKSNPYMLKSLFDYTNKRKISTRPVFKLLHKIIYLKKFPKMNLKNAIELENRIITLPSSPFL